MKSYKNLYEKLYSINNLILAWRKTRKGKTKKLYVIEFEANLMENLLKLRERLKNQTYKPEPLVSFILRDPKTRKICKSAFPDRIVHHALFRVIKPIFDREFIYDSCTNRIGNGNLFALKRFDLFVKKASKNNTKACFVLKADIKHYFQEVNHCVLMNIIKRKIKDEKVIWLIERILANMPNDNRKDFLSKGMPLGNLTSQLFANIYLNELDYFVKHKLKVKYYLRYVDNFVILHSSKKKLKSGKWKLMSF